MASMLGTLARSAAVITAGQLYDAVGMSGPLIWSSVTASLALVLVLLISAPARVTARGELGNDRGDLVGVRIGAEAVGAGDRDEARVEPVGDALIPCS